MKFLSRRDIPFRSDDRVFKASPVRRFIPFVVFLCIVIGLFLLDLPRIVTYISAACMCLFVWIAFGQFRASLQPANWLLRCNDDGIIIKYRSFLNWRFPADDVQAVAFDYSELAWVRMAKEQRTSPSTDGQGRPVKQIQRLVYLDLCLANADASALEARLQAEQNVRPAGLTVNEDYPVEVLPGGIVQLRWNGTSPSVHKAIEYIGRRVKIADAQSTKLDLTHDRNLSPDEEKAKIIELAKSGDKMAAATLARQVYGYNLSDAVAFVDKLQSGG